MIYSMRLEDVADCLHLSRHGFYEPEEMTWNCVRDQARLADMRSSRFSTNSKSSSELPIVSQALSDQIWDRPVQIRGTLQRSLSQPRIHTLDDELNRFLGPGGRLNLSIQQEK